MKKIISLLILSLVLMIGSLQAGNVTPTDAEITMKRKGLITKIDRNVIAMELMFTDTKTSGLTKKTLYHRYWVVMMDFRHQLYEDKPVEQIEKIEKEIQEWNSRTLQLLHHDTKNLEYELSTIMEVDLIKKIVLR